MTISFEDVNYCPLIRTRPAELNGLYELDDNIKDYMLPVFVIGKWPRLEDVFTPYNKAIEAIGERPHILDLTRIPKHQNDEIERLLDPADSFVSWRSYINKIADQDNGLGREKIIPVVQFGDDIRNPTLRHIVQQARKLEKDGKIALHIDITSIPEKEAAKDILLALDDPAKHCICILDAGYLSHQSSLNSTIDLMVDMMNSIRAIDKGIECISMGSSYPKSAAEHGKLEGEITILERKLYQELGGRYYIIYGDHSSIHPRVYDEVIKGFVPRIDYPLTDSWLYYRSRSQSGSAGYVECAQRLIKDHRWDENLDIWGTRMIKQVAAGNTEKMGSPAKWIQVRVNVHLYRQIMATMDESPILHEDEELIDEDFVDFEF